MDDFFWKDWYLDMNTDVAQAGMDPLLHYNTYGWQEGRNPSPMFDTSFYMTQNQDVAQAGVNPLQHYLEYGWKEGRDPYQGFDTSYYLENNLDVAVAGINPLLHYYDYGWGEDRASVDESSGIFSAESNGQIMTINGHNGFGPDQFEFYDHDSSVPFYAYLAVSPPNASHSLELYMSKNGSPYFAIDEGSYVSNAEYIDEEVTGSDSLRLNISVDQEFSETDEYNLKIEIGE